MSGGTARGLREQARLSYRQAANLLGVSLSTVWRWEHPEQDRSSSMPAWAADRLREIATAKEGSPS